MTNDTDAAYERTRRGILRRVGAVGTAALTAGCTGETPSSDADTEPSAQTRSASNGGETPAATADRPFPPEGRTEWGDRVTVGDGAVRPFTTAGPSGGTDSHGVLLDRDALQGLPSAKSLEAAGEDEFPDKYGPAGGAAEIHTKWSLQFFVPFPRVPDTPITFLGFNWNPGGHPPEGVWTVPHFDVHFHMRPPEAVDAIAGPRAPEYSLPDRYVPEGYARPPNESARVVTDMGEHLFDPSAPEHDGGSFTNTLIWGVADGGDGVGELSFVEPMLTRAFLRDHTGTDRRAIAQPDTYRSAGNYPTAYAVRDVPEREAVAVVVEDFERFAGEG
ncbi:hypothetical protein I7X12_14435 [Halosimplex litoreum]|uniref:DUF5602 domain-containing protein n=1 Tax=Halosimplex litoreum TaxID=1198301 RepID=A0A7T3FWS1_9EURY|nr:hypothetical protein [Halosimplex litoreum]QPV61942.1 hypothetical protein I7X12_14435 [Halosimplex litoreum]